jgi:TrmH family RNA methyltransferase
MERISALSSPSPALALVHRPEDLEEAKLPSKGLFLALDGIRDPGNLGTILRIADWFGIDAVYASPDTVDVFNPKVVQATMGAIFRVRFHYTDIPALCRKAVSAGGKVYGTFLDGENMYQKKLDNGTAAPSIIVIGNEANGISAATGACVSDRLYIPPYPANEPGSESLNAAVATAVTVAEFRRLA